MIGNNIIQILFLILIIIFIKKFGLTTYGRRRKIRSYIDVTENEKRKIILRVKIKKFFIFIFYNMYIRSIINYIF